MRAGTCGKAAFNEALRLVPGGGVEPPRAEARRILSPLRLPVPPSRLKKVSSSNSAIYCRPAVIGCTRSNRWGEFSRQLNSAVQCKYRIAPALAPTELGQGVRIKGKLNRLQSNY